MIILLGCGDDCRENFVHLAAGMFGPKIAKGVQNFYAPALLYGWGCQGDNGTGRRRSGCPSLSLRYDDPVYFDVFTEIIDRYYVSDTLAEQFNDMLWYLTFLQKTNTLNHDAPEW